MFDYAAKFSAGLTYAEFLSRHGTPDQQARWAAQHAQISLTAAQREVLAGFTRRLPVVCLAGAWCGDCVQQCPIFDHFAAATPRIELRFFDRDAHPDLAAHLRLCGGARVPTVVFLNEDLQELGRYGDRTLAKYRQLAAAQLGPACPTGFVPPSAELQAAVLDEWLGQFERAHWMARLSPRLRERHGD
ncbi:MAG: thioredoxin family protein [Pirellulales bacterium]|nr:thioredoxin family protein [Pirellulales bacterium]